MLNLKDGTWVKIEQCQRNNITMETKKVRIPVRIRYRNDAFSYVAFVDGQHRVISDDSIREVMSSTWPPIKEK